MRRKKLFIAALATMLLAIPAMVLCKQSEQVRAQSKKGEAAKKAAIEREQSQARLNSARSNSVRLQGKNVEAAMFQLTFHTRNNKTRYRGLMKQKIFALSRCLWVNCVRLALFEARMAA